MGFTNNSPQHCKKTHRMQRTWGSGTHIFPVLMVLFFCQIAPTYTLTYDPNLYMDTLKQEKISESHHMRNAWFSHQFPSAQESAKKNPSCGEILENSYSSFSHSIRALFPSDSYTSLHGKCMAFLINFSQHGKMQQNPPREEDLG